CPYLTREASGTSGMTAAMNGSVNLSVPDGWIPEFVQHGKNGFSVPAADPNDPKEIQDVQDRLNLMRVLTQEIQPMYYQQPEQWWALVMKAQREIRPFFDSDRMATAYYEELYKSVVTV
ncbi:MAG: alpha-glucan family phosphorylase, partial [Phaeodactylibacter sp.]|nr:alpha-glucan family phosphorylase [Phaeodactylibacter sp.]